MIGRPRYAVEEIDLGEPSNRFGTEATVGVVVENPLTLLSCALLHVVPRYRLPQADRREYWTQPLRDPGVVALPLKSENIPVLDDIDFTQLRSYVAASRTVPEASLGPDGLAQLKDVTDRAERAIRAWKDAEKPESGGGSPAACTDC